MTHPPTKIAYEEQYADSSGTEFAIRYNAAETPPDGSPDGVIEFENIDTVQFPANRIDWLIERLNTIKDMAQL
jgi:hypothetical protein